MNTAPRRIYIICILLTGTVLLATNLFRWNFQRDWILTAILSIFASITLLFQAEGATNRTRYDISFLVYAFTLVLLGSPAAMVVILVSTLVEWAVYKYSWNAQIFNLSMFIVVVAAANRVYELANPARVLNTWEAALGMLAAMLVFTLLNHLLVGIFVWLARGENFAQSGIFQFFPVMMDLVLLSLGAGTAVLWSVNPLAIILVLLPLYLINTTLRVPALERQTETDQKTGVYNHHFFAVSLENELRRADRFDRPLTVVMADLDLLRNINNAYGHLAGDEVLIGVAKIMKSMAREYDIVARFGGEEFSMLMPETTPEEAYPLVEAIREAIARQEFVVPTSVTSISATMSFGIAGRVPGLAGSALESKGIIHNADMALYHAKLRGRNRASIYNGEGFDNIFQSSPAGNPPAAGETHEPAALAITRSLKKICG